ncbi:MAG: hypothetical protein H0X07_04370 [Gemmatimonadales bacterium]|nr:hypothetical protein [Gemmatimonadales bacterium]
MGDYDGRPWESEGDLPWDTPESETASDSQAWQGELYQDDWPENLAGPEYWLYKKQRDE